MVFSQEQKLLNKVVIHSDDVPATGLLDGQMGIALTLAHYARRRRLKPIGYISDQLTERILNTLSDNTPLSFSCGLCGIGWGIEYLIQNHYMKGNSMDICEAINQKLINYSVSRMNDLSLERGAEGWLHYILAHIQGCSKYGVPFPHDYLQEWYEVSVRITQSASVNNPTLKDLLCTFQHFFLGEEWHYHFNLGGFSHPDIKPETFLLGLRNGLCGYIETHYLQEA